MNHKQNTGIHYHLEFTNTKNPQLININQSQMFLSEKILVTHLGPIFSEWIQHMIWTSKRSSGYLFKFVIAVGFSGVDHFNNAS